MNEPVEETNKTARYKTIGYSETINTGNYENRKYYAEVEPNGASHQQVIEMIQKDILEQEAMHDKFKTLSQKIESAEYRLENLKTTILKARYSFDRLEQLVLKSDESEENAEKVCQELESFKEEFENIKTQFEGLGRKLEITWQTYDEEEDFDF